MQIPVSRSVVETWTVFISFHFNKLAGELMLLVNTLRSKVLENKRKLILWLTMQLGTL